MRDRFREVRMFLRWWIEQDTAKALGTACGSLGCVLHYLGKPEGALLFLIIGVVLALLTPIIVYIRRRQ